MTKKKKSVKKLMDALQERAKELSCLYEIVEILSHVDEPLSEIFRKMMKAIPPGWQHPEVCQTKIIFEGTPYTSSEFNETPWVQSADIKVQEKVIGSVNVYYTKDTPAADDGPFLKEEAKLILTIAERLGHFLTHRNMKRIHQGLESAKRDISETGEGEWRAVLEMLQQTDKSLYMKISRKMLNHLCWNGVRESEELLQSVSPEDTKYDEEELLGDWNIPHKQHRLDFSEDFNRITFQIAAAHYSNREILNLIQKWIQEDKISSLARIVNRNLPLGEVADAIRRFHKSESNNRKSHSISERGIAVSLIRRILGDQLQFINVAKDFINVHDFYHLLKKVIFNSESHGKLGGKSAGLCVATQILREKSRENELLADVKIPKTWYISSDVLYHFVHYNNLDDVVEQKYKELNQIRLEYPHIVQAFKSGHFPSDIINGLSVALDDYGDCPIIVRSSSLLEDRMGAAFCGKYKSLFLANQGSKQKRLENLMDAIAEVYASVVSPDAIEYRAERGLIDFGEEMGILIQAVVGTRVGRYFLPSYAGVAFSRNEFRWSPRIKREDGLIRIVPGLGTRAVDRLSDDYPVLIAPGQPNLKVNISIDEILRYSPRKIDVINIKTNRFETIDLDKFMKEAGHDIPGLNQIISMCKEGHLSKPMGIHIDMDDGEPIANFAGLISNTSFVKRMQAILKTLEESLDTPVDIEFASDGKDLYLLQCRPQSHSEQSHPAPIPRDIPEDRILFSANRYISNGRVPDITHIVLVDPVNYSALADQTSLFAVGRAVSKLNKLLPKRQFILMGPGRWGCRDDIKSGVKVTYSDINNTAVLTEIALQKGKYVPELSFGTHFFQDLVEANIRYLPLYPDEEGVKFNNRFIINSKNILPEVLPEFAHLSDTVKLIDVPANTEGKILRVLMNAELDEAVGILDEPGADMEAPSFTTEESQPKQVKYWRWRLQMAEQIAAKLDPERYGVNGFYVFGSTKNASAGPGSDIDVLIHFRGTPAQLEKLSEWLGGWSLCLGVMNYMRTGYKSEGLLDVHIVTDDDITKKTSYAVKIGAVTDAARPLPMKKSIK